jgi:hypothetical protein
LPSDLKVGDCLVLSNTPLNKNHTPKEIRGMLANKDYYIHMTGLNYRKY